MATVDSTLTLRETPVHGFEKVIIAEEPSTGLKAIVCIHSTKLGPALGGTRIYPYASTEQALEDVKRLAVGMTHKSALAEAGIGGGKSVIIADPKRDKTEPLLRAFGKLVHQLQGRYICAEDIGSTPQDMEVIRRETPYVTGLEHEKSSGNPSPFTAWGVFRGIQAVCKRLYGSDSVQGRVIAIQGVGSVGQALGEYLFWHGARLIVSDLDRKRAEACAKKWGGTAVVPDKIMSEKCDIFAPCAMGGVLNSQTIPRLRCRAVAGAANNQLLDDRDGDELMMKGILYAPDMIINAGGLLNVVQEIDPEGYDPVIVRDQIDKIYERLIWAFETSAKNQCSTLRAAMSLVKYRLQYGIGKRVVPPRFHHKPE